MFPITFDNSKEESQLSGFGYKGDTCQPDEIIVGFGLFIGFSTDKRNCQIKNICSSLLSLVVSQVLAFKVKNEAME